MAFFIYALLLFGTFGFTPYTVRGILLCLILLTASYSDLRYREVDDHLSVMVLLTSFIGCGMADLPGMLLGGLFVFGMMLVVSLMGKESCIGGADIFSKYDNNNCQCGYGVLSSVR